MTSLEESVNMVTQISVVGCIVNKHTSCISAHVMCQCCDNYLVSC